MGRLKSVAINRHASNCSASGEEKMPCCEDISQELKVEEVTQVGFDFDSQPELFQIAFVQFFLLNLSLTSEQEHFALKYYTPPPPEIDYQADFQVFLI